MNTFFIEHLRLLFLYILLLFHLLHLQFHFCNLTFFFRSSHETLFFHPLRSSQWRCSVRKCVLRNFAKFTGKHLYQSLVFKHKCFPVNFAKFLRTPLDCFLPFFNILFCRNIFLVRLAKTRFPRFNQFTKSRRFFVSNADSFDQYIHIFFFSHYFLYFVVVAIFT